MLPIVGVIFEARFDSIDSINSVHHVIFTEKSLIKSVTGNVIEKMGRLLHDDAFEEIQDALMGRLMDRMAMTSTVDRQSTSHKEKERYKQ